MKHLKTSLVATAVALASFGSNAAIELYNKEGMTFSADGLVNVFYTNTTVEDASGNETDQSRVKMGFLPNIIGFNFSKQVGDVKVETRQSFWVSINDSDLNRRGEDLGTASLIDVRQFYAKVSGDWGSVLLGKDFGLFNRSNILGDELLLGYGHSLFGLQDGGNVSFGNISSGYTYPFPKSQITYTTPERNALVASIGIMDPNKAEAGSEEDMPRIEFEAKYTGESVSAWVNGMTQTSEGPNVDADSQGLGYGVNFKSNGFSFTASGYTSEGVADVVGLDQAVTADSFEQDGYLVQASYTAGSNRFVISNGESTYKNTTANTEGDITNTTVALFHTLGSGVILVAEYTKSEDDAVLVGNENNGVAIGAVVTF